MPQMDSTPRPIPTPMPASAPAESEPATGLEVGVTAGDVLAAAVDVDVEDFVRLAVDELVSVVSVELEEEVVEDEDEDSVVGVKSLGGVCPGCQLMLRPLSAGKTARAVSVGLSVKTAVFAEAVHTHP